MPRLGQTVSELMLRRMQEAVVKSAPSPLETALRVTTPTGSNPGNLKMLSLVPAGLPRGAALVVALHGCTQDAVGYDAGAGWSELAQRHGFALLLPEQQSSNNPNACFNWFQPEDVTRDRGEVASIAQMIQQMVGAHGLDPARVYVTGLSAGGAMTAAMLATYPELFAGGAIIAGLPFGAASNVATALEAMRHVRARPAGDWGDLVRHASPIGGPRPPVQVWHGSADAVVRVTALDELAKQWCDVAGVAAGPTTDKVGDVTHQAWRAPGGRVMVETFLVPGMGHGVPMHYVSTDLDESVGTARPYMLEAGIGSTRRIAQSWGLLTQAPGARPRRREGAGPARPTGPGRDGPIANAFRWAGLT